MYEARLGDRAAALNPLAAFAAAGLPMAFGSDSPVTPLDPWGAVAAAVHHTNPDLGLSARAAFTAHTRGGWRAAGDDEGGVLVPGAPATIAVWAAEPLRVVAPDTRIQAWSTDARSGVQGLPDVTPGGPRPACLLTMVDGCVVGGQRA
jgi:hypothetical protein